MLLSLKVILIISGNLSFLNWLTILPSLCCFDDQFLLTIFPSKKARKIVMQLQNEKAQKKWGKFESIDRSYLINLFL